ncbi:MAG: hypothetical protein WCP06_03965 [Verrucomicrobiota bacterium]
MFKALNYWLPAYLRQPKRQSVPGLTHVLVAVCDHFEPFHNAGESTAFERVAEWKEKFPRLEAFRDVDGCPPRHTFFYPVEQYHPMLLEEIAAVCRATACEMEIHLHHHRDTAENFRATLQRGKLRFAQHGLLSRDESGALRFGFIHGNWALDHSHPHGRGCGVRGELPILRQEGCYADFTFPSAPDPTQPRTINSLYYASDTGRTKSHDFGRAARVGYKSSGDLLLVQGPLGLNWDWRKCGIFPRIENADLTGANPPTLSRLKLWLDSQIHVRGRPEWLFIKLHTHGAISPNREMLLGDSMHRFHQEMARFFNDHKSRYALHYVSAREMVNIVHAAEDGCEGSPGAFRDYRFRSNIVRSA